MGGIALLLMLGCNNGGKNAEADKGLSEIIANSKKVFLDAFVSFGDLIKESFGINKDTTKQKVGEELDRVGKAVKTVKDKLEGIKGNKNYNFIKDKADNVINKAISTLEKIVNGASEIEKVTKGASEPIGNAANNSTAVQAVEGSVKGLVKGISMIYEAAKEYGTVLKGEAVKSNAGNFQAVGKLFGAHGDVSDGNGLKAANEALNAVSGADILAAIEAVKDKTDSVDQIANAKNAYAIAIANTTTPNNINDNVKNNASAISAGLALKAMAQGGKLTANSSSNNAPQEGVNAVLIGAVKKTVNEIMSTIRRTVDKCLKDVSDCIKENSSSEVKSK